MEASFLEAVESYNVRAIFTGHVHKENVWKQNGIHVISLAPLRNGPYFQLIKKRQNSQGEMVLDVISSSIVDGALSTKYLGEIPLTVLGQLKRKSRYQLNFSQKAQVLRGPNYG